MADKNYNKNNDKDISSTIHSVTTFLGKKGESSPVNSMFSLQAKGYDTMFFTLKLQGDTTSFTNNNYYAIATDDLGDISEFLSRASEEIRREMLSTDYKALIDSKILLDKKITLKRNYVIQITSVINVNGDTKSRSTTLTFGKIDESGELANVAMMYLPVKMLGFFGTAADMSFLNTLAAVCLSCAIGTNIRYQSHRERQYKAYKGDTNSNYNAPTQTEEHDASFDSDEFPF